MSSPPKSPDAAAPTSPDVDTPKSPGVAKLQGEETRARAPSFNDYRWRTSSFSEPGRIVVIAVDASDNAKKAFEWYLDNVHRSDDLIVLVHCPEAPRLPTFSFRSGVKPPVHEWKKVLDDMNEKTSRLEQDFEGTLIAKKLRYKIRGESMKNPGEGICKICIEEKANLICIGTRGLSSVKRAMLGSVSDFVVRNAGIPTLIIPHTTPPKK